MQSLIQMALVFLRPEWEVRFRMHTEYSVLTNIDWRFNAGKPGYGFTDTNDYSGVLDSRITQIIIGTAASLLEEPLGLEKTSMRMLRLRAYYDPEQTAGTHLDHDLSEAIAANDIVCVNYTPTPTRDVSEEIYKEYKKSHNKPQYEYGGHMIINRFSMIREGKNPIQRALRYLACSVREYQLGSKVDSIELVYSSSTPPTQGMLSALVAKKLSKRCGRKVPFVFNLQDVFPDSLVTAGMAKKGSLIWKIGRKIEDFTYRSADKIIVISEDFKRNILEKGVPEEKIVVIPNWIDSNTVYPVSREENVLFERFDLPRDRFYICYSGNIGHSQNIEMLLEAASRIQQINPDIVFVIIGEGAEKENLIAAIEKREIDNVKVFSFQPYDDIAHVFSLGDADLIISKKGTGSSSVPSKTWSIMAAGRPILASFDADSELVNLITKTQSGVFADADDVNGFVDAVIQLYEDASVRTKMGNNGRAYVKENLSKETCTQKYIDTLLKAAKC